MPGSGRRPQWNWWVCISDGIYVCERFACMGEQCACMCMQAECMVHYYWYQNSCKTCCRNLWSLDLMIFLLVFLNATGFVNCMNHLAGGGTLSARQFEVAFFGYLCVTVGLDDLSSLGVTELDTGVFSGCPICANTPGCESNSLYACNVEIPVYNMIMSPYTLPECIYVACHIILYRYDQMGPIEVSHAQLDKNGLRVRADGDWFGRMVLIWR